MQWFHFIQIIVIGGVLASSLLNQPAIGREANSSPNYYSSPHVLNYNANEPDPRQTSTALPKVSSINLLNIDKRRQVFSPVLLSPDRRWMAFSEMRYLPANHSVFTRGYVAPLSAGPTFAQQHMLPEDRYVAEAKAALEAKAIVKEAKKHRRQNSANRACRWLWLGCNDDLVISAKPIAPELTPANPNITEVYRSEGGLDERSSFHALVPVDWAYNSRALLMKLDKGVLYQGIDATQTVILDAATQKVTHYPQARTAVAYYWQQRGITPSLKEDSHWHVIPTGWQPGSSEHVELEGWQYLPAKRVFLGHWRLNVMTGQVQLMTESYQPDWPVAANGTRIK